MDHSPRHPSPSPPLSPPAHSPLVPSSPWAESPPRTPLPSAQPREPRPTSLTHKHSDPVRKNLLSEFSSHPPPAPTPALTRSRSKSTKIVSQVQSGGVQGVRPSRAAGGSRSRRGGGGPEGTRTAAFLEAVEASRNRPLGGGDTLRSRQRKKVQSQDLAAVFQTPGGVGPVNIAPGHAIRVYARLKPLSPQEQASAGGSCVVDVTDTTVTLVAPDWEGMGGQTATWGRRTAQAGGVGVYSFTRVFRQLTGQKEFFTETTLPLVENLLRGSNSLLFTYGITGSGKTHTVEGHPDDQGILPRSIDLLFNSITRVDPAPHPAVAALWGDLVAESVTPADLGPLPAAGESYRPLKALRRRLGGGGAGKEVGRVPDGRALGLPGGSAYAVWVSYVEVYNEQLFDLLADAPVKPTTAYRGNTPVEPKRPHLKVAEVGGRVAIKGLRSVRCATAEEAIAVMARGRSLKQHAHTASNMDSSRSHAICMVRLGQVEVNETGAPVGPPQLARLSIVDLAGLERAEKTGNSGIRLVESGKINTSLLTLSRCLEAMRRRQAGGVEVNTVPFRDSKLTHLFQEDLMAADSLTVLVVNVNPLASAYDETNHSLKFAALARSLLPGGAPATSSSSAYSGATQSKGLYDVPRVPTPAKAAAAAASRAAAAGGKKQQPRGAAPVAATPMRESVEERRRREQARDAEATATRLQQQQEEEEANAQALEEAEERVRREVTEAMEMTLASLEADYQRRMEMNQEQLEEKYERKLAILQQQAMKQRLASMRSVVSSRVVSRPTTGTGATPSTPPPPSPGGGVDTPRKAALRREVETLRQQLTTGQLKHRQLSTVIAQEPAGETPRKAALRRDLTAAQEEVESIRLSYERKLRALAEQIEQETAQAALLRQEKETLLEQLTLQEEREERTRRRLQDEAARREAEARQDAAFEANEAAAEVEARLQTELTHLKRVLGQVSGERDELKATGEQVKERLDEVLALQALNRQQQAAQTGGGRLKALRKRLGGKKGGREDLIAMEDDVIVQNTDATPSKTDLVGKDGKPRHPRYELVEQRTAATGATKATHWKGDVNSSVSGTGVSVVFRDVERIERETAVGHLSRKRSGGKALAAPAVAPPAAKRQRSATSFDLVLSASSAASAPALAPVPPRVGRATRSSSRAAPVAAVPRIDLSAEMASNSSEEGELQPPLLQVAQDGSLCPPVKTSSRPMSRRQKAQLARTSLAMAATTTPRAAHETSLDAILAQATSMSGAGRGGRAAPQVSDDESDEEEEEEEEEEDQSESSFYVGSVSRASGKKLQQEETDFENVLDAVALQKSALGRGTVSSKGSSKKKKATPAPVAKRQPSARSTRSTLSGTSVRAASIRTQRA